MYTRDLKQTYRGLLLSIIVFSNFYGVKANFGIPRTQLTSL